MKKFTSLTAILLFLSLACSKDSATTSRFVVSGVTELSADTCAPYAVIHVDGSNNPVDIGTDTVIQPGISSGEGGVYSDSTCDTLAWLNITMAADESSVIFYFKSTNPGVTVLQAGPLSNPTADTLTVTVE